jgi:hypothetical protein
MDFGEAIGYGKDQPDFLLAALTGDPEVPGEPHRVHGP